jgi:hypothetical protein
MVEKHYGHIEESYVTKTIRDRAPRFGKVKGNVVRPLRIPLG